MVTKVNVRALISDQNGNPQPGALVVATLNQSDVDASGGYILPEQISATADASGIATLALWPNELGSTQSQYDIKLINPDTGKTECLSATIPNANCDLHIVANLPPYPGKTDGQLAVDSAVTAAGQASTSATNAATSATNAATSATNAAASASAAAASASAAATSESNAAGSASTASTKAQAASDSADSAAASAASASDKIAATTLAAAGGASLVGNTPAGNIAATTVQGALNELDTEKVSLTQLAAASGTPGASLVGYGGTDTVGAALDSLRLADYTALRAYTGSQKSVYVTGYLGTAAPSGIAGMFVRDDSDTTTADNGGTVIVASNGKRWKRAHGGVLTPEMFGAARDGVTNDTAALNKWATALQSGKASGKAAPGTYRVSQASLGVIFSGLTSVTIDFAGAIFKVLDGDPVAGSQAGFMFTNCVDCDFYNFTYDANRAARTPAEVYSHSINIGDGMLRCRFWACRSINAVCDPWYVAPQTVADQSKYPTDIHLHDCEGFNGYRNNLSLIGSVRFRMFGGSMNGATGTAPQCGIDVEPDSGTTYGNDSYEFHNVDTSDNLGYGLQCGGPVENPSGRIINHRGKNNAQGLMNISRANGLKIINPRCGAHSTATRGLIDIASTAAKVTLINPIFKDITANGASNCCIYVHASATGTVIKDIETRNTSCPTINAFGQVSLRGIDTDDCSAVYPVVNIGSSAANSEIENIAVKRATSERAIYVAAAKCVATNLISEDCGATNFPCIQFDSTATGSVLRGAKVVQTSGTVPTGQYAVGASCAMNEISSVSALGGYTSSNVLNVTSANAAGTKMFGINPDPLTKIVAIAAYTYPTGLTYLGTAAVPLAALGDRVQVTNELPIQGVQLFGYVQSAGNVAYYSKNDTGSGVSVSATNSRFIVNKA